MYTDEITTCHIIVIFDYDKKYLSLIHADPSISLEDIKAEQVWVGDKNSIFIIRHKQNSAILEEKLNLLTTKNIKIIELPDDKDAVSVCFKEENIIPTFQYFNTKNNVPFLYNHNKAMQLCATYKFNIMLNEIYGQLKINDIFKKGQAHCNAENKVVYENETWKPEELSMHFQKELKYPEKRLLFDEINFCNNRGDELILTEFSRTVKNDIVERIKKVRNLTFREVYMKFMEFFHDKEPDLNPQQFEQYYDGQCTELARFYCYISNNMELLKSLPEQTYWIKMVERYSQFQPIKGREEEELESAVFLSRNSSTSSSNFDPNNFVKNQEQEEVKDFLPAFRGGFLQESKSERESLLKLLKIYGIKNSSESDLEKALRMAALNNKLDDADILIKNVKHINAQNESAGDTALHIAVRKGNAEFALKLLAKGASLSIINKEQKTPVECTENTKLIAILTSSLQTSLTHF